MHFPYILHCNGNVFYALTNDPDKLREELFFNNLPFDLSKATNLFSTRSLLEKEFQKQLFKGVRLVGNVKIRSQTCDITVKGICVFE